jgi:2'-5' RNA ligase
VTEQVRSFIAIELPEEVRSRLAGIQARLKPGAGAAAKWVAPVSIHLTLKFLGGIAAGSVPEITRVIELASRGRSPFRLTVGGLGVFPSPKRVRVVWVGVGGEIEKLTRLQQRIESGLVPLGFAAETRAFQPHLTLARLRDQASPDERQKLGSVIAATDFSTAHKIEVTTVSLMRSQLTREGAVYNRLSTTRLTG